MEHFRSFIEFLGELISGTDSDANLCGNGIDYLNDIVTKL